MAGFPSTVDGYAGSLACTREVSAVTAACMIVPTEVYTVDPESGDELRVRDVNFIGTPLAAIQRIMAFGKDYQVDNSYCFAESGSVPVATVAPAMLVEELELQRSSTRHFRPPILSCARRSATPRSRSTSLP